jgi:hypothetical protein
LGAGIGHRSRLQRLHRRAESAGVAEAADLKYYLTTKHTKATKVSDIDITKLLNFVLFVTFVVKVFF